MFRVSFFLSRNFFLGSLLVLGFSSPVFSVINIQATAGGRQLNLKKSQTHSAEMPQIMGRQLELSLHLNGFSSWPIAVGVSTSFVDFYDDNQLLPFAVFRGQEWAGEFMIWSPIRYFGIQPYGQLNYNFAGSYERKKSLGSYDTDVDKLGVLGGGVIFGLNFSPVPYFAILLEYGTGRYRWVSLSSENSGDLQDLPFETSVYSLGMEFHL